MTTKGMIGWTFLYKQEQHRSICTTSHRTICIASACNLSDLFWTNKNRIDPYAPHRIGPYASHRFDIRLIFLVQTRTTSIHMHHIVSDHMHRIGLTSDWYFLYKQEQHRMIIIPHGPHRIWSDAVKSDAMRCMWSDAMRMVRSSSSSCSVATMQLRNFRTPSLTTKLCIREYSHVGNLAKRWVLTYAQFRR